MKLIIDKITIN